MRLLTAERISIATDDATVLSSDPADEKADPCSVRRLAVVAADNGCR